MLYYSGLPRKEDHLTSFLENRKKILVSTSAILVGVDFTDVDLVIYYGLP
jgi:superfamily II DNA helicase RecQ